ncbi:SdrD B-like domain-containing protein [Henriciella marina]|uniref:SdrD B-like domain-containing protein n=1 Tax=Henriciella marina TaxID=453851 RepID=UPI0012E9D673|nr:SdrD B-like domain-containing protein [Henriciella marina]
MREAFELGGNSPINTGRHPRPELRVSASATELTPLETLNRREPLGEASGRSGQLRGSVFIDHDGNGVPSRGDVRLEGHPVLLTSLETGEDAAEHPSASFGQYAFEGLTSGRYALSVSIGWDRVEVPALLNPDDMMQIVEIAVPPDLLSVDDARLQRPPSRLRTS